MVDTVFANKIVPPVHHHSFDALTQLRSGFDRRTQSLRCIHTPCALRCGRVRGVGLQARRVSGEVPDKVDVSLARLVQLGVLTQALVVDGKRHHLGLLQLEPVDRHLQSTTAD